jgi:hypothetical protein
MEGQSKSKGSPRQTPIQNGNEQNYQASFFSNDPGFLFGSAAPQTPTIPHTEKIA